MNGTEEKSGFWNRTRLLRLAYTARGEAKATKLNVMPSRAGLAVMADEIQSLFPHEYAPNYSSDTESGEQRNN
jgi:hypothetical protein